MKTVTVKKHRVILSVLGIILALLFVFAVVGMAMSFHLTVNEYSVKDFRFDGSVKVCHLTDLHCRKFGKDNLKLIEKIISVSPDVIFMTGDMISLNSSDDEVKDVCSFIEKCVDIAPVYFSFGNKEKDYIELNGTDFRNKVAETGAIILDYSYKDVTVGGQKIRIGGAYGHLKWNGEWYDEEKTFLDEFNNTNSPTFLLSHMSEGFLLYDKAGDFNIDYVFCGHSHGGQIRLPFVGGLFTPDAGWFPKYTKGLFNMGNSTVLLSAGLGTGKNVPRFGNPPEIAVLNINGTALEQ